MKIITKKFKGGKQYVECCEGRAVEEDTAERCHVVPAAQIPPGAVESALRQYEKLGYGAMETHNGLVKPCKAHAAK